MTKKEKIVIKEIIEFLLNTRTRQLAENEENSILVNSYPQYEENQFDLEKENKETMDIYDNRLIALNNLLNQKDRYKEVLEIEKIQVKKYLSTSELAKLYPNMSLSTQVTLRGRIHDKLPYHQNVAGGKITYIVEEVENWKENQHK